jgi:Methyltransferase domain
MGQGYRNVGIMAVTLRPVVRDFLPPILARALRSLSKRHGIPSLPKDDLMLWLGFINPGMLIQGNIELFAYCLARLPSKSPVLEIGSFAGPSLNHIILLLRRARILHRCMEFRRLPVRPPHRGIVTFDDYRMHVIETFRRNVMLFSGDRLPHHIELSSDAFFAAWEARESYVDFFGNRARLGGPVAFAYIDGDHSYEQSMRDFENVDRHLQAGGFIFSTTVRTEAIGAPIAQREKQPVSAAMKSSPGTPITASANAERCKRTLLCLVSIQLAADSLLQHARNMAELLRPEAG